MKTEFLEKAEENLKAAQICFEQNLFNACANRAYFAALQAAVSALVDKGVKREKIEHKNIHADFNRLLIRRKKIYPSKLRSYLLDMQSLRDKADYEFKPVSKKEALRQIAKANDMIEIIQRELEK